MFDYLSVFEKYEALVEEVDRAIGRVQEAHPDQIRCRRGCSDCCSAVFDLTLVESFYLNAHYHWELSDDLRLAITGRAEIADRQFYRIKHKLHRMRLREGKTDRELLWYLAEQRVRCPLLNASEGCDLYAFRPITCRVYGIPTAIQGEPRICELSGFESGRSYPTVHLDRINDRLFSLSRYLLGEAGIADPDQKLNGLVVPASEALMTEYHEDYFRLLAKRSLQDAVVNS
jgi:Fe-S-cluster containining protein